MKSPKSGKLSQKPTADATDDHNLTPTSNSKKHHKKNKESPVKDHY